ncbi:protein TANC2 [Platysternon megacephalum]|uniref:Protein TANC2 n=1 Tax=Platysternon megacephalum TaxID=55544 RepID=A0A4D9EVM1_9SAUR|nr:protein TANC2 [Platysternon megacephalum]
MGKETRPVFCYLCLFLKDALSDILKMFPDLPRCVNMPTLYAPKTTDMCIHLKKLNCNLIAVRKDSYFLVNARKNFFYSWNMKANVLTKNYILKRATLVGKILTCNC